MRVPCRLERIILLLALSGFALGAEVSPDASAPISDQTRALLLSVAKSRGVTNVVEITRVEDDSFVLRSTNRFGDISIGHILGLTRTDNNSTSTNAFLGSDHVYTNFVVQVEGAEQWITLGDHTSLEFAQNATKAFLKSRWAQGGLRMCERPTNATNVVKLILGNGQDVLAHYFRLREDRVNLVRSERLQFDTVFGFYESREDPYFPPGLELVEKQFREHLKRSEKSENEAVLYPSLGVK